MRHNDEEEGRKIVRDASGRFDKGNFSGGARFGSQCAKKLTTPELCQEAYRQYCEWIAAGNTKEAWVFEHPEMSLTSRSMENYIKNEPDNFPAVHKELAECKSLNYWLQLGKTMMIGDMPKCQPAIYQMFMRNKFGWDKETRNPNKEVEADVRRLLQKIEED